MAEVSKKFGQQTTPGLVGGIAAPVVLTPQRANVSSAFQSPRPMEDAKPYSSRYCSSISHPHPTSGRRPGLGIRSPGYVTHRRPVLAAASQSRDEPAPVEDGLANRLFEADASQKALFRIGFSRSLSTNLDAGEHVRVQGWLQPPCWSCQVHWFRRQEAHFGRPIVLGRMTADGCLSSSGQPTVALLLHHHSSVFSPTKSGDSF